MGIFDLPTELFQLIAKEMNREDMKSLSQLSHAFRVYCEPIIFHRITLSDGKKRAVRINDRILKRLGDPKDTLTQNIRHIRIGYASEKIALPEKALSRAIRNLKVLESFTWRTWYPMPLEVLQALQEAHPSTPLIVIARERNNLALDERLISSPHLHTLDIKLCAIYDKNYHQPKGKSELGHLKRLLMQGGNLKVLRLQFEKIKHGSRAARNVFQGYGPSEVDPVAFKFDVGEILPTLEELVIRNMFEWAKSPVAISTACRTWRSHQDWSALRVLDLRLKYGELLLQCLIGSVPLLQTLKLSLAAETLGWPVAFSTTLYNFLESTRDLKHLHVEDVANVSNQVLLDVRATVATGLISLYVQMDDSLGTWRSEDFSTFLTDFPRLRALALDGRDHQAFGVWSYAETKLPPELRLDHVVRTTREYVSPRTFATRHARTRWYDSGAYIKYPGKGYLFTYYMLEPPGWLGFTEKDAEEETARKVSSISQLLERFGLAAAALQSNSSVPYYPEMDIWSLK